MLCSFQCTVYFSFQAAVNVLALGIFIMTEGLKDAVVKDTEGGRLAFKLSVLVPSCLDIWETKEQRRVVLKVKIAVVCRSVLQSESNTPWALHVFRDKAIAFPKDEKQVCWHT